MPEMKRRVEPASGFLKCCSDGISCALTGCSSSFSLLNQLATDEVMAIGDNFNDLEMLEFAGTAVVMGNADPSLLEREEFYTTVSNDENGVAAAVEKFILGAEKWAK